MSTTRLLVIGGTAFVGRAVVEEALARGFQVTTFNRGQTNPDLFPQVEKRHGDRDGGLDSLGDGEWDLVVDTCGYLPHVVGQSVALLANRTGWYSFISSLAVFADFSVAGLHEDSSIAPLPNPPSQEFLANYGPLKVLCEQTVLGGFPDRATITRPGLIVGPNDRTGRFGYWLSRVAEGGDMLAPGAPQQSIQFIDVRDLAAWTLDSALNRKAGVFNMPGSNQPVSMGEFLQGCALTTNSTPNYIWCDDDFLKAQGLAPYFTPPMWTPAQGPMAGMGLVDNRKAFGAGMKVRPMADTLRDTWAWMTGEGAGQSPLVWPRGEEQRVLAQWAKRQ